MTKNPAIQQNVCRYSAITFVELPVFMTSRTESKPFLLLGAQSWHVSFVRRFQLPMVLNTIKQKTARFHYRSETPWGLFIPHVCQPGMYHWFRESG